MQSIMLQAHRLLSLTPMVLLTAAIFAGCTEGNTELPKGYEENIVLDRSVTEEDLAKLRTETIEEMCKSNSEYRARNESEEQCVEAYVAVAPLCTEELEGTVSKISTVNFVNYASRFANCLGETVNR